MLTKIRINKNTSRILKGIVGLNAFDLILLVILQAGEDGISGKDLEKRSGLSRTTVWNQRDRLRDVGMIYYETKGKRTMYYPTKLALNNSYFRSWIKYKELFNLLETRNISVSSPFYNIEFPNYLNFKPEMRILEFVLRIGILLTYIFIQYLGPFNMKQSKRIGSGGLATKQIEESVKNVISQVKMLTILRQTVFALGYRFHISTAKKFANYSFFELEPKSFESLVTSFSKVFPEAFNKLQAIDFEAAERLGRERIEQTKKRREQLDCKHNYQIQVKNKTEFYYCPICKFRPKINQDVIIDNKELIKKLNSRRPPNDTCRNHRWKIQSEIMPFIRFECALCSTVTELLIDSEQKLDAIEEEVKTDFKNSVHLCEDIELFFHHHSNRKLTVNHYIRYYKRHYAARKIVDLKSFTSEIKTIYEILAKNDYIEYVTTGSGTNKLLGYIRRENIEVKSVTGKKLLTLATNRPP